MKSNVLKSSRQRSLILDAFLNHSQGTSVDELFGKLRAEHPTIGYSTVYRALKLFAASGIAREIRTDNSAARYMFVSEEELTGVSEQEHERNET